MIETFTQQVEDRIEREQRRGRTVRIDQGKSVLFQVGTGRRLQENLRPAQFEWRCAFLQETKFALTGVNTTVTPIRIVVNTVDSGVAGVFDFNARTYTDASQTWIDNEWSQFYLKVDTEYYQIISNLEKILTLDINIGVSIDDGSYDIVPFVPNSLVGTLIQPDENDDQIYVVESNTETTIRIAFDRGEGFSNIALGTVTTGDAGAPFDTFDDTAFGNNFDDQWNGYTIYFYRGNNAGEYRLISDFQTTTGRFILSTGFTNAIAIGDKFKITKSLLWVGTGATWRIETGYTPSNLDFENSTTPPILRILGSSKEGNIDDQQMPTPYLGMYSAEVYVAGRKSFKLDIDYVGALSIYTVNTSTNERLLVFSSPVRARGSDSIVFSLPGRVYTRIEIYNYVPETLYGSLKVSGIAQFLNSWRDLTSSAPTWVSLTGADSSNNDDTATMLSDSIELEWTNNVFLREGGKTEIFIDDDEGGLFDTLSATVLASETKRIVPFAPGTTKWFKLRHLSASGVIGGITAARKGVTANPGLGNVDVDIQWSDNGGSQVFVNENGWFNNAILKAKVIISSDLTIDDIRYQESGQSEQSIGSSSPALAPAIVTEAISTIRVKIIFTNGMSTSWLIFNFQYDKTAPSVPVFVVDSGRAQNYEIIVPIDSGGVDSLSGLSHWEWFFNDDGTDPISSDPPLRVTASGRFRLGLADYELTSNEFYLWARSVDFADNKSTWVQYNGASGFLDLNESEITGSFEIRDIHEFAQPT